MKKRFRQLSVRPTKGADVLYETMHRYRVEMREIMSACREAYKQMTMDNKTKAAEIKYLTAQLMKIDEFIVDIAHKLAPYQTPKLETIEVKNQVEHKFVIKSPNPIENVEDWMKRTGADVVRQLEAPVKVVKAKIEELDLEQDEEETHRILN